MRKCVVLHHKSKISLHIYTSSSSVSMKVSATNFLFQTILHIRITKDDTHERKGVLISLTLHNSKTWYFREILLFLQAFLWDCGLQISPDWQSHQGLEWALSQNGSATLLKSSNLLSFSWQNLKIASRPASNFWFPAQWTWRWGAGDIWEQFPFPAKVQMPASNFFQKANSIWNQPESVNILGDLMVE